ncbi:hypothetical protein MNBD_GAMMA08-118 [hydrothermal vent metagenome]|uniref:Uncharacterized protein n=1 Tax=hydrothermal vent metagenome TaxID=652676 RepID=A0A3B0XJW6_9ZZZZ
MKQLKVMNAVENICSQGCESVNAIIEILETGKTIKIIEHFSESEIKELKSELKSIMDVYNK